MFDFDGHLGRDPATPPLPPRCLLGTGRYRVFLSDSGTGASWVGGHALTVWRADPLEGGYGFLVYLRDLEDGAFWSAGRRPCPAPAAGAELARPFESGRPDAVDPTEATGDCVRASGFHRVARSACGIETALETCVLADRTGELRRLRLRNLRPRARRIEITTYGEVALQEPAAFAGHPAFSRLFVRSELEADSRSLLFRRRARANGERHPWMIHSLLDGEVAEWETDRARFLGRGRSPRSPRALTGSTPLFGATGDVLDPIFSLRTVVEIGARGEAERTFVLGAAADRVGAVSLVRELRPTGAAPAFAEAARDEESRLLRLGMSRVEAGLWERMAGALLCGDLSGRQADLVPSAADLDLAEEAGVARRRPFALVRSAEPLREALLERIARGRRYWDELGLENDLVVLSDREEAVVLAAQSEGSIEPASIPARREIGARTAVALRATAALVVRV